MIQKEHGVRVSAQNRWEWPGIACAIFDLRWETEPGWISFSFDAPLLCAVMSEIGGRCQTRLEPDRPVEGDYFGTGHLSFATPSQSFVIYASEMRHARIACYQINLETSDCLTSHETMIIDGMKSRYMFRDDPLYQCARLLSEHDAENDRDLYALSLTRALQASLLDLASRPTEPQRCTKLTGQRLTLVIDHINDHLDESITVEELSRLANLSAAQVGQSFREATGLSLQRWQMDARIRSAQRLMLDDPTESLAAIASLVGFSDASHFSRAFLEIVSTTPSAWLRQYT
ncbi:helix-turn-helix domain-containing protein [Bradyrhizobium genosp. P]|uniref:helix-turn-helix domain-containing protein n=1 Tax=Bradyrhizobium genosp. P TaxID=83641 RepID=UPI003CF62CF1